MKRIPVLLLLLVLGICGAAQTAKPPVKLKVVHPHLKTLNDSASYVIGQSMAMFCQSQGVTKLNTPLITRAVTDILTNKRTLLKESTVNILVSQLMEQQPLTRKQSITPVTSKQLIRTRNDSISYAIGMDRAIFFKQQGINRMNMPLVTRGINDVTTNKPVLLHDSLANDVMNTVITKLQEEKVRPTIATGKTFLVANGKRAGVKTTASGLQYEVIVEGTGIRPEAKDSVTCHYRGKFINGTEFDASYNHGAPITFALKRVITGWTEGLQLMREGSTYKFYVPYNLGYGPFEQPGIPGGSTLIFEVSLLAVKKQ
ncbi:MAG: FKBP-type peptidyl-prolyl cis-trans isomerase [Chitinophagaceae bacterium]|nr:FKBP-type peptidyl-prolyl cis-trans isomerase [Chitinophagaceae bacterium]